MQCLLPTDPRLEGTTLPSADGTGHTGQDARRHRMFQKHLLAALGRALVLRRTPGRPPWHSAPGTRLDHSLARPNTVPGTRGPLGHLPRERDPGETRRLSTSSPKSASSRGSVQSRACATRPSGSENAAKLRVLREREGRDRAQKWKLR